MIQYRRLSALLIGAWLGAGIFADLAVTENFQTVDRFLQQPHSAGVSRELNSIGRAEERLVLRRNAGEENNDIFENWERAELVLGTGLFLILLFGTRPSKGMLGGTLVMLGIVLAQHFLLTPVIADMGRQMADVPQDNALTARFWTYHGFYSGSEILKLVVGGALAVRLSMRRKRDEDRFARRYDAEMAARG